MGFDLGILAPYTGLILSGLLVTLYYTIASSVLGLAIGLLVCLLQLSGFRPATWLGRAYVELFRNIPLLVLLLWSYYALPIFMQIEVTKHDAGLIALSCYVEAFYAEILRAGVQSIDVGQTDASAALGMTYAQRMRRIILPQALRRMLPPLAGQTIIQMKNTTLLSVITIPDVLYQSSYISSLTYRPMEIYTVLGILFPVLLIPLAQVSRRLERLAA